MSCLGTIIILLSYYISFICSHVTYNSGTIWKSWQANTKCAGKKRLSEKSKKLVQEPGSHIKTLPCTDLDKSSWTFLSGAYFTVLCCTETYHNLTRYFTITMVLTGICHSVMHQCTPLWRRVSFIENQVWSQCESNFYDKPQRQLLTNIDLITTYNHFCINTS